MIKNFCFVLVAFCVSLNLKAQTITTLAGGMTVGYSGDGGDCHAAQLNEPQGITVDNKGNIYFADLGNNCIRKISASGVISTIAGNGTAGYNGDNIIATAAMLNEPHSVAVDTSGNVYIGDYYNHSIRKIDVVTGIITTIAGTGVPGYNGDDIPATNAELYKPSGIAVDDSGNIFISDYYNNLIRKINSAGIIYRIAGNGSYGYSGDKDKALNATMKEPYSVALDKPGNIYITDIWNYCIRKVNPAGIITTIAGNGTQGYTGDGGAATLAELSLPQFVAVDNYGKIFIADASNGRIRMVDTSGVITTIAGDGIDGYNGDNLNPVSVELSYSAGVTTDGAGNIYIADQENNRIRFIASTLAVRNVVHEAASVQIFPNPASDQITVNTGKDSYYSLIISNSIGQILLLQSVNSAQTTVDIKQLSPGLYTITLKGSTGSTVEKLVKL